MLPTVLALGSDDKDYAVRVAIAKDAAPAVCAAGYFKEMLPPLQKLANATRLEVKAAAVVGLGSRWAVSDAQELAAKETREAKKQRAAAVVAKHLAEKHLIDAEEKTKEVEASQRETLRYLKDVEVQKVKAAVNNEEAVEMKRQASIAQQRAVEAEIKANDAANKVEAEKKLADKAQDRAEELQKQVLGLGLALVSAMGPCVMYMIAKATGSKGHGEQHQQQGGMAHS